MTVNEKLKESAIKEYIERIEERDKKYINYNVKLAVLIMGLIYFAVFAAIALRNYFSGHFEDGVEIFGIGMAVAIAFLLPACLFTWALLRKKASTERNRTEEELRKTSYAIEDDSLVRKIEGDGRRTKRYKLEQIRCVSKDGFTVTFEYGNEEVELLDFYEPPLFDSIIAGD